MKASSFIFILLANKHVVDLRALIYNTRVGVVKLLHIFLGIWDIIIVTWFWMLKTYSIPLSLKNYFRCHF